MQRSVVTSGAVAGRVRFLVELLDRTPGLECRRDPDAWVPEQYLDVWVREPQQICMACPMRQPCLELGELRREREGIYGGTTPGDRRRRRRRGFAPGQLEFSPAQEVA